MVFTGKGHGNWISGKRYYRYARVKWSKFRKWMKCTGVSSGSRSRVSMTKVAQVLSNWIVFRLNGNRYSERCENHGIAKRAPSDHVYEIIGNQRSCIIRDDHLRQLHLTRQHCEVNVSDAGTGTGESDDGGALRPPFVAFVTMLSGVGPSMIPV